MNEKEFTKYVLEQVQNKPLGEWYNKKVKGTKLIDTTSTLHKGILNNEINIHQALILALFIGMTTEQEMIK